MSGASTPDRPMEGVLDRVNQSQSNRTSVHQTRQLDLTRELRRGADRPGALWVLALPLCVSRSRAGVGM